ncbi:hypothetical protein [Vibrio tarriae]|nr:hypothetical protein [Vibrio tarriae]
MSSIPNLLETTALNRAYECPSRDFTMPLVAYFLRLPAHQAVWVLPTK